MWLAYAAFICQGALEIQSQEKLPSGSDFLRRDLDGKFLKDKPVTREVVLCISSWGSEVSSESSQQLAGCLNLGRATGFHLQNGSMIIGATYLLCWCCYEEQLS